MRILFVATGMGSRGPEHHAVSLARALAQRGHEVRAMAHPQAFIAQICRQFGIGVFPGRFRNALDLKGLWAGVSAIREFSPDFILAGTGHEYWPAMAMGRITDTRVVLFRHIQSRLKGLTRWAIDGFAAHFIAVSTSLHTNLLIQGFAPERTCLLHNPIDLGAFRIDEALRRQVRAELGFCEQDLVVGYVGGMETTKGPLCLAQALNRAMRQSERLRGLWVIPATAHGRLQSALAPSMQQRHSIIGWTQQIERFYAAMDVLAVPSIWPEVFGRVAAEAQACGVPVIGSRIGGIPEAIDEGRTGFLVPPGDADAWASALLSLPGLSLQALQDMGREGAERARRQYSFEKIADEFASLVTRNPRAAAPPQAT